MFGADTCHFLVQPTTFARQIGLWNLSEAKCVRQEM